jgi:hypothetical protein
MDKPSETRRSAPLPLDLQDIVSARPSPAPPAAQLRFSNPLTARYETAVNPETGFPGLAELVGSPIQLLRWAGRGDNGGLVYRLVCR